MDIINHGTQGFLIGYGISQDLLVSTICGLVSALPDIGSAIKPDLYTSFHTGTINRYLRWIPLYGLHTWLDTFCHGDGQRWYAGKFYEYFMPWRYRERMWIESLSWSINILVIILYWKCNFIGI